MLILKTAQKLRGFFILHTLGHACYIFEFFIVITGEKGHGFEKLCQKP